MLSYGRLACAVPSMNRSANCGRFANVGFNVKQTAFLSAHVHPLPLAEGCCEALLTGLE